METLVPNIPLEYNPQTGVVRRITNLPSGRAVLNVGFPNRHEVRAIITSDLAYLGELPIVGAIVEVSQNNGLWTYVRTVNTNIPGSLSQAGDTQLAVNDDGVWMGHRISRLGVGAGSIDATVGRTKWRLDDSGVEASLLDVGTLLLGSEFRITAGQSSMVPTSPSYEITVKDPATPPMFDSEESSRVNTGTVSMHSHPMQHFHVVDLEQVLKWSASAIVDGALVDGVTSPPTIPSPAGLRILDDASNFLFTMRTLSWSPSSENSYNVQYGYKSYGSGLDISAVLAGSTSPTLAIIATDLRKSKIDFRTTGLVTGGERLMGEDSPPAADLTKVLSVEVVAFRVQTNGGDPLRVSPWSAVKRLYYVNLEPEL